MEATDASRLVCVVVVSYQEYSLTHETSTCDVHGEALKVGAQVGAKAGGKVTRAPSSSALSRMRSTDERLGRAAGRAGAMGPASPAKRMDTWLGPLGLSPSRLIIAARTLAYCTEYTDYTPPVVVPCQAHQTPHRATLTAVTTRKCAQRRWYWEREKRVSRFLSNLVCTLRGHHKGPVSYTHLTLPTTPYV